MSTQDTLRTELQVTPDDIGRLVRFWRDGWYYGRLVKVTRRQAEINHLGKTVTVAIGDVQRIQEGQSN